MIHSLQNSDSTPSATISWARGGSFSYTKVSKQLGVQTGIALG